MLDCGVERFSTELFGGEWQLRLTRQAITKHLRVLERARLVHGVRVGRENLFVLDPRPIVEMKDYLALVSREWEEALARLKVFVKE